LAARSILEGAVVAGALLRLLASSDKEAIRRFARPALHHPPAMVELIPADPKAAFINAYREIRNRSESEKTHGQKI
jgi:hypothetical protein